MSNSPPKDLSREPRPGLVQTRLNAARLVLADSNHRAFFVNSYCWDRPVYIQKISLRSAHHSAAITR